MRAGSPPKLCGVLVGPRYGRAGLADDLVYRHPGAEIVVRYHGRDAPGDGTPRHEPELLARAQAPEAAVDVDEHGCVLTRGIEVDVLGERGSERHVQAVVELRADVARSPARRMPRSEAAASGNIAVRLYWASSSSWVAKSL